MFLSWNLIYTLSVDNEPRRLSVLAKWDFPMSSFFFLLFLKQSVIYPVLCCILYILGWNSQGAFKVYLSFNDSWWICILMSLLRGRPQHSLGEFYTRQQTSLELWSCLYITCLWFIWGLIMWPWGSCGFFCKLLFIYKLYAMETEIRSNF